jgi:hypothetical protein
MRPPLHEFLFLAFLSLMGVRIILGVRRRESRRQIIEGTLFPGVFVLLTLSRIFPRWWIPLGIGAIGLLLAMLLSFLRSRRR